MAQEFDVVVIGAGPGGYVAAIKAAQAGFETAVIEKEALGGVCLNWGCIPTKALLKSAELYEEMLKAADYGIEAKSVKPDFQAMIKRSRKVAEGMSGGIAFLMKKNKITVIEGTGCLVTNEDLQVVDNDGKRSFVKARKGIIIAGGHKARTFPNLPIDGENVFQYRKAMTLPEQPKSLLCIGAGAIGMEFGYFYNTVGTEVTIVEALDRVLPIEDAEVSGFVRKAFEKKGITIKTGTTVEKLEVQKKGVKVTLKKGDETEAVTVEKVLVAVGFLAETEGLHLKEAGVETDERGFIKVDANMRTTAPKVYAIGDIAGKQLLAHKASAEGEAAVAHIAGKPHPVDYSLIPGCTYCQPQVASIGLSEDKAKEKHGKVKVGRFQFMASGKAKASGHAEGFVKLIFEAEHDQLVGAHITGFDATELLAELCVAIRLETTASELMHTVHAHPTMSEAIMEAAADALGVCVHQ